MLITTICVQTSRLAASRSEHAHLLTGVLGAARWLDLNQHVHISVMAGLRGLAC